MLRVERRRPLAAEARPQLSETQRAYLGGTAAVLTAAGVLRAVGAFVPGTTAPTAAVQGLYLLTVICILLGFIGWYAADDQVERRVFRRGPVSAGRTGV